MMSRMFIIDLTDAFAVCNMNTYGLLVKLESKLHFLLSFVKMKLGLMKGTGFRLWGPNFSDYPGNRCCTSQAETVEVLKISKFSHSLSVLRLFVLLKVPIGKLSLCTNVILFFCSSVKVHNNAVGCSFINKRFCSLQSNLEMSAP